VALTKLVGASQVVFGSDYPHAEGLERPLDFTHSLAGLSDGEVRRVMRDNARGLLGLPE
jgi:predicted TIM-barrel fold metal-dependent hydrolase